LHGFRFHCTIYESGRVCRVSLWSGCSSNYYVPARGRLLAYSNSSQAGASISIMLIESPEFIHGEDVNPMQEFNNDMGM